MNGEQEFIGDKAKAAVIIDPSLALSNFRFTDRQQTIAFQKCVSAETHNSRSGRPKQAESASACDVSMEEASSAMARLRLIPELHLVYKF